MFFLSAIINFVPLVLNIVNAPNTEHINFPASARTYKNIKMCCVKVMAITDLMFIMLNISVNCISVSDIIDIQSKSKPNFGQASFSNNRRVVSHC